MIRRPHFFVHGNLVFGAGPDDAWAGYRLDGQSYPGLSVNRKIELKGQVESFAYSIEADFQLIRCSREWSAEEYARRAGHTLASASGHRQAFGAYLARQRERLSERRVVRPEVFCFVRLSAGRGGTTVGSRARQALRQLASSVGLADPRALDEADLAELRRLEERTFDRVYDFMPCERARSGETARLIRGGYGRGLGELEVDSNWRPEAIMVDEDAGRFEPVEYDLLRLHESRLEIAARGLRVDSELGTSHQAMLVMGALPEESSFPGPDVELLFAPLECGFPVDAIYSCEWVANRQAQKLAQKRMVDADQQAKEEGFGEHGPSVRTARKVSDARELQDRLQASDHPPFLRSAVTLCVGAGSAGELEERVERLRADYAPVRLHRPLGEQHRLFVAAMPAQPFPVRDYLAHLLPEQLGAMVPTAISHAGSDIGPYIGYALGGSRSPIQFDAGEASRQSRPPTVLLTGSLGSGKTMALELLLYQAFLQGSSPIVDIDPKGDHKLDRLPGVAEHMEPIELGSSERYRGLLDPMRIGDEQAREDLAYAFLTAILPDPVPREWQTEIRGAVAVAAKAGRRTIGDVLDELRGGGAAAQDATRALEVHLEAGLARLGYGLPGRELPEVGSKQVVSLRIRNLARPLPGTARSELQEDERISQAVLRLLAAYALRLCASDEGTHSVLALDEAWALLSDSQGRALMDRLSRMGRSMNITPILASQIVGDASDLQDLVGSYFAFGVETEAEAERALALLRLDADDEVLRQRLIGFREGRCYFRDVDGRVVPMRINPEPEILAVLDTTPRAALEGDVAERASVGAGEGDALAT
ncbi:MAG: ATP-binding protein [Solirubrobacterales bacterium]